jgi:hypothetical protein
LVYFLEELKDLATVLSALPPHTGVSGETVFLPEDSEDGSQKQAGRKAPKCYALSSQQHAVVVKEPRDQSMVLTYRS